MTGGFESFPDAPGALKELQASDSAKVLVFSNGMSFHFTSHSCFSKLDPDRYSTCEFRPNLSWQWRKLIWRLDD